MTSSPNSPPRRAGTCRPGLGLAVAGLLVAFPAAAKTLPLPVTVKPSAAPAEPAPSPMVTPVPAMPSALQAPPAPAWSQDLERALALAGQQLKPVLLFFTSRGCGWCHRLKRDTLGDPDVQSVLEQYLLVEVDVMDDVRTARSFQVGSVPQLFILDADGRTQLRINGYIPAPELRTELLNSLNPSLAAKVALAHSELTELLKNRKLPDDRWTEVFLALGTAAGRRELHDLVLAYRPVPAEPLLAALDDPRLAVRLGAAEVIEELTGDSAGFEPWLGPRSAELNAQARQLLARRLRDGGDPQAVFTALNAEQVAAAIQDVLGEQRERRVRAVQRLIAGGQGASRGVADFLARNPDLPPGTRRRLKEVQYTLYLTHTGHADAARLARQLLGGNLEMRLQALGALGQFGRNGIPVLREFLADPDPLVRESAVDALAATGSRRHVVPLFKEHLDREQGTAVRQAFLKGLGAMRSRTGLEILLPYLRHDDEDLVAVAIASVIKLKHRNEAVEKELFRCLEDQRWRVRVAALDAVAQLDIKPPPELLSGRLRDPDAFVRAMAIKAVAKVAGDDERTRTELVKLFAEDDTLKAPIVTVFSGRRKRLPDGIVSALRRTSPEILVGVLQAMEKEGGEELELPGLFAGHENLDVACAALRLLAKEGWSRADGRGVLIGALRGGEPKKIQAVLEKMSIRYGNDEVRRQLWEANRNLDGDATDVAADILDGFFAPPAAATPAISDTDVLDEFLGAGQGAAARADTSCKALIEAMVALLDAGQSPEIHRLAATRLAETGSPAGLPWLAEHWQQSVVGERRELMHSLMECGLPQVLPLLKLGLRDPAPEVRSAALLATLGNAQFLPECVTLLFAELLQPEAKILPREAYDEYRWRSIIRQGRSWGVARRQLLEWLGPAGQPNRTVLALVVLADANVSVDRELLEPNLTATDPFVRRAAWALLGHTDLAAFLARHEAVRDDPSEFVRQVLPNVLAMFVQDGGSYRWVHYFDREHFDPNYRSSHGRTRRPELAPEVIGSLRRLARDPVPVVALDSCLCLLGYEADPDLQPLLRVLERIPDRSVAANRLSSLLKERINRLGPGFKALVPFLEQAGADEEFMTSLRSQLGLQEEVELPELTFTSRPAEPAPPLATFLPAAPAAGDVPAPLGELRLLFFSYPGCKECAQVKGFLREFKHHFPRLVVQEHNIRLVEDMRLNEVLCERFGVPENLHLVTPAVFAAAGALVHDDATFSAIGQLLARSANLDDDGWVRVQSTELVQAESRIGRRYATISVVVIALAGLLDGINPCAFATIVFLISYLHVARRRPREIAQIGLSFILGVFLTYYALGLGLVEIVTRLHLLQQFGIALTWIMGLLALLLMLLNLRDGILCLQGRLADINLQLPAKLKDGIHAVIRGGARHAHFVVAAFLAGVAISMLELACTGQVYAPTILYMLKTGQERWRALSMLAVYNLAFVAPLFVIFLLAYHGLRSETLRQLLVKRAATVKFATAGLFLLLFLFLVFGHRLGV